MIRYRQQFATIAAAIAITATPALAASNPASSLSVTAPARAATPGAHRSKIAAGPTATLVNVGILAAIVGGVLLATSGSDNAASN